MEDFLRGAGVMGWRTGLHGRRAEALTPGDEPPLTGRVIASKRGYTAWALQCALGGRSVILCRPSHCTAQTGSSSPMS